MSSARSGDPVWTRIAGFAAPLIVYAAVVIPLGIRQRDLMNADAMVYIRRAQYLLHGQFYWFISEHWSLMLSWLIAPLLAMKVDGLYAARGVLALIGAVELMLVVALMRRLLNGHWIWSMLGGMALAPFLAMVAIRVITPDLLLGTWLMGYFLVVLDKDLPQKRGRQFAAGIVGGFAYLAKAFALPFVVVHLLATLIVHASRLRAEAAAAGQVQSRGQMMRGVLAAYGRGLLGFVLIASPWIGAMSWKYKHPTVGTAGAAAHGVTGVELIRTTMPGFGIKSILTMPPGPYLTPFETPEKLFPRWNPFANRAAFKYQLQLIGMHALELRRYLSSLAWGHAILAGVVLSLVLLLFRSSERWKIVWLLGTLLLCLGPFLLVVIQYRYINPHVAPIALVLCLLIALQWRKGDAEASPSPAWVMVVRGVVAVAVMGAFLAASIEWGRPLQKRASNTYRLVGVKLRNSGMHGPFASDSPARSILVAYHCGHKYVGFPNTHDPQKAQQMLRDLGVQYVVLWNQPHGFEQPTCLPEMVEQPGWTEKLKFRGATVYEFDPALAATTRPTTRAGTTERATTRRVRAAVGDEDTMEDFEDEGGAAPAKAPPKHKSRAGNKEASPARRSLVPK